jgi:hypothetical protein
MMQELKLWGGARILFEQVGIYTQDKELLLIFSIYDPDTDQAKIQRIQSLPLEENPTNLLETDMSKEKLKSLLDRILSGKLPTLEQKRNYEILANQPNNVITQAVIRTCMQNTCICPLFYSPLGCVQLSHLEIRPTMEGLIGFTPPTKTGDRKIVSALLTCLAHKMSKWEFLDYLTNWEMDETDFKPI